MHKEPYPCGVHIRTKRNRQGTKNIINKYINTEGNMDMAKRKKNQSRLRRTGNSGYVGALRRDFGRD